ncbi:VCBS repeat-containing protein [Acidobacteria bacterium ACD]|nr:MAG: VCBS repeat-containing protein [Acidobacteriota bacterium]MCE7956817.1 VCBS repeat-containing protein [Acidobacteria bacterium ACB2]MDL1949075.1 VCBS repeat-containing protein [Acidobacteria bacterium ACD]
MVRIAVAVLAAHVALAGAALSQTPVSPPLKTGFPVTLAGGGPVRAGAPAVADLGLRGGKKSIVFGTSTAKLYVVDFDGTVPAPFPVSLPAECAASPAVADLTGDGAPEIVVPYGSNFSPGVRGGVRAYRRDGSLLWDRPAADFAGQPGIVISSPAVGDVDGDGSPEVAWGGTDGNLYLARGADGVDETGWPRFVRDTVASSPALADVDGDGRVDVVIGVDTHAEPAPYNTADGGCLHVLRFDGTSVVGFPRCVDQVLYSSPAVGDIDGDGRPEIVIGTGTFYSARAHRVYAFRCNGLPATGWPVSVEGEVATSPALGDLTGDGVPEVVVTDNDRSPSTTFHVYAFGGDGTQLWKSQPRNFFGTTLNASEPVIADVAGDGTVEVLVPTNTEVAVFSAAGVQLTEDGAPYTGAPSYFTETSVFNAAVADMEGDGAAVEVIAVSASPFPTGTDSKVYVWNPKATGSIPWGAFHQNEKRTGVLPGTPGCANVAVPRSFHTLAPCRAVDTRNADGPLGGPAIEAQRTRTFYLLGACGIPTDAVALSLNVTVVSPTFAGNLRLFPGVGTSPLVSTLNYKSGQTRANNAVVRLGAGEISVQNDQGTGVAHVLIDVTGYFR